MALTPAERIAKAEAEIARLKRQQIAAETPRPELKLVPIIEWQSCYDDGWAGLITPESFAHPAKIARGLVKRIFDHLFEIGALSRGSIVCDPFGGIGTTGIEASYRGCPSISVELEPKFHALSLENVELHRHAWTTMGLPLPVYLQGDSRRLREHVAWANVIVSSPPYATQDLGGSEGQRKFAGNKTAEENKATKEGKGLHGNYGKGTEGQLGEMPTGDVDVVVSSPPYIESLTPGNRSESHEHRQTLATEAGHGKLGGGQLSHSNRYSFDPENLGNLPAGEINVIISSPPYAEIASGAGGLNTFPAKHEGQQAGRSSDAASQDTDQRYGDADGQLAKLPKGEVDAVIGSPPYSKDGTGNAGKLSEGPSGRPEDGRTIGSTGAFDHYGETDGQLGAMKSDGVDAILSSPPYEGSINTNNKGGIDWTKTFDGKDHRGDGVGSQGARDESYGKTEGQIGAFVSDTFWSAAKQIVAGSYAILKPGGYAVWIVKAFVRNKEIVDFPNDWRRLCEHVGFETCTEVHAMLVKEEKFTDLYGNEVTEKKERKSFFRRLAESKGSPEINYEVVWVMRRKP